MLAGLCVACGSSERQPKPSASTEPAARTATPPGHVAAPTPNATAPTRAELVDRALSRVGTIQAQLAELRGLAFDKVVPAKHQEQADFRRYVTTEIARELPAAKSASLGRALFHLGLLPEQLDLAATVEEALVSQAGAYYDPTTETFYLVMVPNSDLVLDSISSHELSHALQDQHFDLEAYYGQGSAAPKGGSPAFTEDELNARRFVVEGEATMMMVAYTTYAMAKLNLLDEPYRDKLRAQLAIMANMKPEQLAEMSKSQAGQFADLGEDMAKAVQAMDKIPLYILVPLLESYTKGALPVYEAFVNGGWDAVAELYRDPPQSTEQVLHPAEKLVPKRDYPVSLRLPATPKALRGSEELYGEVMGELLWRVYFLNWTPERADAAAAGWDGDRYQVYARGDELVAMIGTTWDGPNEAKEFEEAYLTSLDQRFPDGETKRLGSATAHARGGDRWVFIRRADDDVFIVDGATEADGPVLLKELGRTKTTRDRRDRRHRR
jgi:hypothetical protein